MKKTLLSVLTIITLGATAQLPASHYARFEFTGGSLENTSLGDDLLGSATTVTDRFNNTNDAITSSAPLNGASLNGGHLLNTTLSFWMKTPTLPSSQRIIQVVGTSGKGFKVEVSNGLIYLDVDVATSSGFLGQSFIETHAIDDGNWHHIAVRTTGIVNNTQLHVESFVDGVASVDAQMDPSGMEINLFILNGGITVNPSSNYNGDVDDIYFYKSALTDEQIMSIYNYTPAPDPTRFYVDVDATGNNDGSSWTNAFTNLRNALYIYAYDNMEIWVAEGTYIREGTNRNMAFAWVVDSLKIYGGFAGNESLLSERDWRAHSTIFSGDLGVIGDSTDNAYTVLLGGIGSGLSTGLINYSLIDGVSIQDGNGNAGSQYPTQNNGGGFYSYDYVKKTEFKNCTFKNNYAHTGGAVSILAYHVDKEVNFENCIFQGNRSSAYTSAPVIQIQGYNGHDMKSSIVNCLISDNTCNSKTSGTDQNSVFYFGIKDGADIDIKIINTTVANNHNTYSGTNDVSTILLYANSTGGQKKLAIDNSIFYNNSDDNVFIKKHSGGAGSFSSVSIKNSISDLTSTASYYTEASVLTSDPMFTDPTNGDYTLQNGSPAINVGVSTGLTIPTADLAGNVRIVGSNIDMGCYESGSTTAPPTSLEESTKSLNLTAYPNPTTGKVTFSTLDKINSIEVYNLAGQQVALVNNVNFINIESLPSGVYAAKLFIENKSIITKRIIKQ